MNDNTFDAQALIDLVNSVKAATDRKVEYFYYCYSEPSDQIKAILKSYGIKYKVISNKFFTSDPDENTAFILPKCEPTIKIGWD